MQKRLRSLSRILEVQAELHRIEECKLGVLKQREAALGRERGELLDALDRHDTLYAAFIYPMAKRLRAIDEEEANLRSEQDRVSKRLLERAKQRKRTERLHAGMSGSWEREQERRELVDLIDRAALPPKTSLR
ncbi:hypothetical protein G5V57_20580 [Nordella sp. HKS 07]|uniref:hypothetical protein n=1 Tax=Nordella sp. HKS 07 TaxID=2712222 RepID=UPI0013E0ECBA|nr:hypothetical protein [Nordella sp. HKS 07]QIG49909.1 hypothetical protein G5V57_20580 [Nordella sp. HKS 07]